MIKAEHLKEMVIRPTLQKMEKHWPGIHSEAAENLLLGTIFHESKGGYYLRQINGPALGIYQIEPDTHEDVWENYLAHRRLEASFIRGLMMQHDLNYDQSLISNLEYSTAIARLVYYRDPEPLPEAGDIEGLARYWKRVYNTRLGRGKVRDFIQAYPI